MAADDDSKIKFLSKFADLFDSDTYSDLTIEVGGSGSVKFHAHRNILSVRTSFFDKATKAESGFAESEENVVAIHDHSAHAVWRFLRYCYTGDYTEDSNNLALGEEDDIGSLKHPRVHALADMLDVPELKALAVKKLKAKLESSWVTSDFAGIVKEVYVTSTTQDKAIRGELVQAAKKHISELCAVDAFKKVLYEFGEFSGELVIGGGMVTTQKKDCTNCGRKNTRQYYCNQCGNYAAIS